MTEQEILQMAIKAGYCPKSETLPASFEGFLERFATLVAESEREACAKVCDGLHFDWAFGDEEDARSGPRECAAVIRARDGNGGA